MQIDDTLDGFQGSDDPIEEPPEELPFTLAPELVEINTLITYPTRIVAGLIGLGPACYQ